MHLENMDFDQFDNQQANKTCTPWMIPKVGLSGRFFHNHARQDAEGQEISVHMTG
jgi:hypothetical protein